MNIKPSSLCPIQRLTFPKTNMDKLAKLYIQLLHGDFKKNNADLLIINPNSKLSFNSYFNSFYESYWKSFCYLNKICVCFEFKGSCLVSIYRDSPNNGCYLLSEKQLVHKEMKVSEIELSLDEDIIPDSGRVFIDITTFEHNAEIKKIEILADINNKNSLSIGICTFNRQDFLLKNLASLLEMAKTFPNLSKILVVNQGKDFDNPKLLTLLKENSSLFKVYKQNNLGGTGGFTRTLYEVSKNNLSDYHLLMDDDIILDCNVIKTAFYFISNSKKDIAVGGQMLDLFRPNFMHEYGGKIGNNGNIKGILRDTEISNYENLGVFKKVIPIDYNAWWFCMIPTKKIEEIKLPAPIFIRGDDWEYGLRLKENGVETVGLPGIGLWHEPFYAKIGGWQTYYDFRNRMISSSIHKQLKNEDVNKLFLRIYTLLLCHDYQSVALILEAIKDFSKGLTLFESSTEDIHKKVSSIAKDFSPIDMKELKFNPISEDKIRPRFFSTKRKILFIKQTICLLLKDYSDKQPIHLWDRFVAPQNVNCMPYIKTNGNHTYFYLYKHDKKLFRKLFFELIEIKKLYKKVIKGNMYESIDKYREFDFWENVFKS